MKILHAMKYLNFLGLLIIPYTVFSQDRDSISVNEYVVKMDKKLSVKFDVDNDIETLSAFENDIEFKIKPNIDYRTEISVHYRFISFKIGYTPHLFTNYDEANKGKTKTFKLESDFYIKKWIQTVGYSQIKSFYSPDYPVPEEYPTDYLILDQLKIYNIKGTTRYRFNSNYSLKAITTQTEIQQKSAGTFIPSFLYQFNVIDNKLTKQKLNTLNFTLSVGYLHTFVINKKMYASVGASPGIGVDFNHLKFNDNNSYYTESDRDYTLNLDSHLGLGYNSVNWFGGVYYKMTAITRKESTIVKYDNFRNHFQLFIGYRFKAPKFLRKQVDWVEEKKPF